MNKHWSRTPIALALAVAIVSMYSMVGVFAQTNTVSADLSAVGDVTVNGARAISGATIYPGSTITTGDNSSAVVNLGRAGRIELQPNSSARISFTESNVNAGLDAGRVRLSLQPNVSSTVTALSGTTISDGTQAAAYTVDVSCGDIKVMTETGNVQLRADSTVKQVAAGQTSTAGQVAAGTRCARLATAGTKFGALTGGALAALLLAGGAAAAIAIVAVTRKNNSLGFGGSPILLSPTRTP
jgi:hypothetical protein